MQAKEEATTSKLRTHEIFDEFYKALIGKIARLNMSSSIQLSKENE
jgi:hypothetical protein